jgi:hypothetical protein
VTTLVPFVPPPTTLFSFSATLDGASYTVTVAWNVTGQRWYVNVTDTTGNLVVSIPLIGSPPDHDISLVAGYFQTSTLVFRQETQTFEISP